MLAHFGTMASYKYRKLITTDVGLLCVLLQLDKWQKESIQIKLKSLTKAPWVCSTSFFEKKNKSTVTYCFI